MFDPTPHVSEMTLDKNRELLQTQADFAGFNSRHVATLIPTEMSREQGLAALSPFIRALEMDQIFQFQPGVALTMPE